MPVIERSSYPGPPVYQFNGHVQTIWPNLTRRIRVPYVRERLELSDGDFLDLDWLREGNDRLVLITHGLEGSSRRPYVTGAARVFQNDGWDVLAWNCRSCSGEINRLPRFYYHGDIQDLSTVVDHALSRGDYTDVVLLGFSMGGSMTLKYLGVMGKDLPPCIRGGMAFSTPCDLAASASTLELRANRFFKRRFLRSLRRKMEMKGDGLPEGVDLDRFDELRSWRDFDELFSAPLNGFSSAHEFYEASSADRYVGGTEVPVLLVNASNDPLLTPACTPIDLARRHPLIYAETPRMGGHVGFSMPASSMAWSEVRALEFARHCLPYHENRRTA